MSDAVETPSLVLVSSCPLCRQVLVAAGFCLRTVEPWIHEPPRLLGHGDVVQQAEALAYFRAREAAAEGGRTCVLSVATLVALGNRVIGKPFGRMEAAEMLRAISGTRHRVVTGVAALRAGRRRLASDVTYVTMRRIPEDAIAAYLDSGRWLGVAGAYATPGMAERYVLDREGSFSNLLGMPVELVARAIASLHGPRAANKLLHGALA